MFGWCFDIFQRAFGAIPKALFCSAFWDGVGEGICFVAEGCKKMGKQRSCRLYLREFMGMKIG